MCRVIFGRNLWASMSGLFDSLAVITLFLNDSSTDFLVEKDNDFCVCQTPCKMTRYGKELSMVKIPSKASAKYLAKKFNKTEQYIGWVSYSSISSPDISFFSFSVGGWLQCSMFWVSIVHLQCNNNEKQWHRKYVICFITPVMEVSVTLVCSFLRENILVLDIFFEALNYEKIEQKKAYEIAGLLGKFCIHVGLGCVNISPHTSLSWCCSPLSFHLWAVEDIFRIWCFCNFTFVLMRCQNMIDFCGWLCSD